MPIHEIQSRPLRVKKREQIQPMQERIKRHELSLLSLLIEKHPERAKEFLARLKNACESQYVVLNS